MSAPVEISALSNDILLVIFLTEPNNEWISRVKGKHPGLEVRWVNVLNDDHTFKKAEDMKDLWNGVTILCPFIFPPPVEYLKSVRFIQLSSAGIDNWINHEAYKNKNLLFSTSNGAHA